MNFLNRQDAKGAKRDALDTEEHRRDTERRTLTSR